MSNSPGRREVAHRLFAAEFDDADFSYSESDEERAPNYVVTPTGARVNRLFLVGVLTELEQVNEEMLRARVVDPTGAFVVYAGQYQPDELAFLDRVEPPTFLAVTGKARTFEPEDGDRVFTSVRPETINEVDAETRDRWAVDAAERTLERIETMAAAVESGLSGDDLRSALADAGVDESFAAGIPLALDHYGTTPDYLEALREVAVDVARLVADEAEEVRSLDLAPGRGAGDASALAHPDLELEAPETDAAPEAASEAEPGAGPDAESEPGESESVAAESTEPETTEADATGSDAAEPGAAEPETVEATSGGPDAESGGEPQPTTETTSEAEPDTTTGAGKTAEPASEAPTTAEPSSETTNGDGDDIGEFEPGEFDSDDAEATEEPPEDVLDEEERREVEEEYGTDFSTASEVDEPDEGGGAEPEADATEREPESEAEPTAEPEPTSDAEPGSRAEPEAEPESPEAATSEPETDDGGREVSAEPTDEAEPSAEEAAGEESPADEAAADVSVEDAVMEEMEALDEGDGADREALVERVTDRTGASAADVDEAIQDLLMSGQCYEPDDGLLKSI